jgi:hypothetical protein
VTASTTTTIRGVSIFSRQRKRKADVFDIALSPEGIVIRRPGRTDQHMSWERIAQWEIAERPDCVVLTLRGGGSVTPLMVKGWTVDDLEAVMRQATEGMAGPAAGGDEPPPAAATPAAATPATAPAPPLVRRRQAVTRPRGLWRRVVTVVLLGLVAAAVTLVLLQSAGIISWGFLGPTA